MGGNASIMDRVERLAFNAMPASLTGDMWTHVYVQQSNSVFAGRTKPTPWDAPGRGSARCGRDAERIRDEDEQTCSRGGVGDTPSGEDQGANFFGVSHFPCCITNFPQGWPKFAMSAIMGDMSAEPAIVIASLVPAEAIMPASIGGGAHVSTDSQYPFSDSATITVTAKVSVQLKVRIPAWADRASLNGGRIANGTYAVVRCGAGKTVAHVDLNPSVRLEYGWGSLGSYSGAPVIYSAHGGVVPAVDTNKDFSVDGGASFQGSREPGHEDLRSGGPGQTSTVMIRHPLVGQGHYIERVTMSYKYVAGFNCLPGACEDPPHLEIVATDGTASLETLYTSPPLNKYSFDKFTGYSPLQLVDVDGLKVPNSNAVFITLRIVNGRHNVQLQLDPATGFNMTVYWSTSTGPDPPKPPSPYLQSPTNGLGITRGPLVFALHLAESKKVVKSYEQFQPARPFAVDYEIGTNDTWNYALTASSHFTFVNTPSAGWNTSYPFVDNGDYPFYIKAKGRTISSWGYWSGSMITDVPPPSPIDCGSRGCGDEAELRLVPFGLTNIRISVFPWVGTADANQIEYV